MIVERVLAWRSQSNWLSVLTDRMHEAPIGGSVSARLSVVSDPAMIGVFVTFHIHG